MRSFGEGLRKSESKKDFFTESIKRRESNKELEEFEKGLPEGENVQHFISDLYGDSNVLIIFTTSRLIYVDKRYGETKQEEIILSQIKYIESDFDFGYGKIRICSEEVVLEIAEITESSLRKIFSMIKTSKEREEESVKKLRTGFSLTEQIENLTMLKEKDIISNEEVNKAKSSLIH